MQHNSSCKWCPSSDGKTDTFDWPSLSADLEKYLEKKTNDVTQTSGLTWLRNTIYHALIDLPQQKENIQLILKATSADNLEREIRKCWMLNVRENGQPKGELGQITATHWNRLQRMSLSEKEALDKELASNKITDETIDGAVEMEPVRMNEPRRK